MPRDTLLLIESGVRSGPRFVRAARGLGLKPILLARAPARLSYVTTERIDSIRVDTTSVEAVRAACERLGATATIAGITTASEAFVGVSATVCQQLALPGPDPHAIARCQDKFEQRQALQRAGVPVPIYGMAADTDTAQRLAAEIGFPVIVKPVVGRGSSGVRLCTQPTEVAAHTAFLLAGKQHRPSPPRVLIEQFIVGPLCDVEMLNGQTVGVTGGDFVDPPHFTYCGFDFPAQLPPADEVQAVAVAQRAAQALNLEWGPVNTELRLARQGPVVIEVNPRMSGSVVPDLIQLASGIDLVAEAIKVATGGHPRLVRQYARSAAVRYLVADREGVLGEITGLDEARQVPGIVEIVLSAKAGHPVQRHGDTRDHLGYLVAASLTPGSTAAALRRAHELIRVPVAVPQTSEHDRMFAQAPFQGATQPH